jgi:hypothetical protein
MNMYVYIYVYIYIYIYMYIYIYNIYVCIYIYIYTCFGDGDSLLLHGLMEDGSCDVIHLIELIDTAYPIIREHQSTYMVKG